MNRSSDLSVLSSPEQQQHSFNFSSPDTSFNPLPSTPQFAYNPCWYSSELSPPNSYMTNNVVYYQQPHWYTSNTDHHHHQQQQQYQSQQQYQPQQQYVQRQNNSARGQYHPYRRSLHSTW